VRWVTPPASKRTPPARAAQQLVPARPLVFVFGFALLRRACIDIGFLLHSSSALNAGSALRLALATNHCGRALAANGRTARADAATSFFELARPCVELPAEQVRAFECRLLQAR